MKEKIFKIKLWWAIRQAKKRGLAVCEGCYNIIDAEVCHCGSLCDLHTYNDGHAPIPMGCTCGYADQSKTARYSVLNWKSFIFLGYGN